jgi:AcrR family transcriptional regulator
MLKNRINNLKKEIILESAIDHFKKVGYKGTSMNDLAKEIRVAVKTIYDIFGSKEGLFLASVSKLIEDKYLKLSEELSQITDPREKLKVYIFNKFKSAQEFKISHKELWNSTPWFMDKGQNLEAVIKADKILEDILREIASQEKLKNENIKRYTKVLVFMIEGYILETISQNKFESLDLHEATYEILDIFFSGVSQ